MQTVRRFLEMIRFSHTLFALAVRSLFGAVLAWEGKRDFSWRDFAIELTGILACMIFARSFAMAFNRLADRHIDAVNPRTAIRHLPSGQLSVASVWRFTLACCAGFIASTALFLLTNNPWPIYLSIPVLLFVLAYSYTKRFHGSRPLLACRILFDGARGGMDRDSPVRRNPDAARHRSRRSLLGRGLRHHLRLPGRRLRSPGETAQHPRAHRRSRGAEAGDDEPCDDAGDASARLLVRVAAAWLDLPDGRWRAWPACSSTNIRWCGPTTWPASIRRFSMSIF